MATYPLGLPSLQKCVRYLYTTCALQTRMPIIQHKGSFYFATGLLYYQEFWGTASPKHVM